MRTALGPLLSFAAGSRVPDGFGYLGAGGALRPERGVETWISARMTSGTRARLSNRADGATHVRAPVVVAAA